MQASKNNNIEALEVLQQQVNKDNKHLIENRFIKTKFHLKK